MDEQKQSVLMQIALLVAANQRDLLMRYLPKGCCGASSQPDYSWTNQAAYQIGRLLEQNPWISDANSTV